MRHILLVEDDDDIRELTAEVLREEGYLVHEAENGKVALHQIEQLDEPCLVLLDLMMPVMTGPELLRTLHERNRLSSLAVIALSAGGDSRDVPEADRFLRKPIDIRHLLSIVRSYCDPQLA